MKKTTKDLQDKKTIQHVKKCTASNYNYAVGFCEIRIRHNDACNSCQFYK